jgi:hypothetical protein
MVSGAYIQILIIIIIIIIIVTITIIITVIMHIPCVVVFVIVVFTDYAPRRLEFDFRPCNSVSFDAPTFSPPKEPTVSYVNHPADRMAGTLLSRLSGDEVKALYCYTRRQMCPQGTVLNFRRKKKTSLCYRFLILLRYISYVMLLSLLDTFTKRIRAKCVKNILSVVSTLQKGRHPCWSLFS